MKHVAALSALLLSVGMASASEPSEALYRDGQPITLSGQYERKQQANAEQAKLISEFRTAYMQANRPKVALFWNRTLSDEVTSSREVSGTVTSTGLRTRDNYQVTLRMTAQAGSEKSYSLAAPPRAAEFESGFQSTMRQAGAVFVDRSTIIRLSALGKTKTGEQAKNLDYQTLEMSALADYAQYFAEVNFIADGDAEQGLQVRVTMISTSTGEVIADVVPTELYKPDVNAVQWTATDAGFIKQGANAEGQWHAGEAGFYKARQKTSGKDEGQRVAYALMAQMIQQLSEK